MGLWNNLQNYIPVVAFMAGLSGTLHCLGMCGGLVTASCQKSADVWHYQLGRLAGYLALALVAGLVGESLQLTFAPSSLALFSSITMGLLFVYWGLQGFRGKSADLPRPRFVSRIYGKLWARHIGPHQKPRAFLVGLFSLFLPCGLLYAAVIGALATHSMTGALLSLAAFWLGTLPGMVFGAVLIRKLLQPFQLRSPKIYATALLVIGLTTISVRAWGLWKPREADVQVKTQQAHRCH